MKPRECFGIIVRTIGLLLLIYGVFEAVSALFIVVDKSYTKPHSQPHIYMIYSTIFNLLSLYLLRGAPHLMRFCYPENPPPIPETGKEKSE